MSTLLSKITESIQSFIKRYSNISDDIAQQIQDILDAKKMTQKEFASLLGKKESEISKWLTGRHNFTIKSIAKIEDALGEKLIHTSNDLKDIQTEITWVVSVDNVTGDAIDIVKESPDHLDIHLNYVKPAC